MPNFSYLKEHKKFLRNFLMNWKEIGSIAPSSKFLAQKMLRDIDFEEARFIVELGMGTGSITKYILKNINKNCVLLTFETNKEFCNFVDNFIKDNRLRIINDSVLNLEKYLNGKKADYIISGIPLAHLSVDEKDHLLKKIRNSINDDGQYIQFQYTKESYKKIKSLFKTVKVEFTLLSIPPAFVYKCKK